MGAVGQLEFIETTMDKYAYLNILKANLKRSGEKLGLNNDYYFQQDNEPKHTADIVKLWILYNVPKQLQTPLPKITSKAMLKEVLQDEWNQI